MLSSYCLVCGSQLKCHATISLLGCITGNVYTRFTVLVISLLGAERWLSHMAYSRTFLLINFYANFMSII